MAKRTCSIEGCGTPAWARTYCPAHYRRWRLYGSVQSDTPVLTHRSVCEAPGCDRKHYGKGMCGSHYRKWRRKAKSGPPCAVVGCDGLREARGWCKLHYERWAQWGDPLKVQRVPVRAFKPGSVPWNAGTGRRYICEHCHKEFQRVGRVRRYRFCSNRCQGLGTRGPKHPLWNGGADTESERLRHSPEYAEWRTAVFERDGFTCQHCGRKGRLQADHIKSWAKYPDLRFEISNGRTLCKPCHQATPTWGRPTRMHP